MEERLKDLMDAGLSQVEAIEVLILEQQAMAKKKDNKIIWTLLGNFKCPICNKYSKSNLHGSGWGPKRTLRVTCEEHGVFLREPYSYWKRV